MSFISTRLLKHSGNIKGGGVEGKGSEGGFARAREAYLHKMPWREWRSGGGFRRALQQTGVKQDGARAGSSMMRVGINDIR